jgi:uncharacterized protein YfiM (DUF2279 family)
MKDMHKDSKAKKDERKGMEKAVEKKAATKDLKKAFESSKFDNDKGVKEGSKKDMARDKKEMATMSDKMDKGAASKREMEIRKGAGASRPDIMPMKRRY